MARKIEVNEETYPQPDKLTLGEDKSLIKDEGIETVPVDALKKVDREKFMNEVVTIRLEPKDGADPNEIVTLCVNGIRQHIFRGIPQQIKRKYLEVLARSHVTRYVYEKESSIMEGELPIPRSAPAHSYQVIEDTARGRAWLQQLLTRA